MAAPAETEPAAQVPRRLVPGLVADRALTAGEEEPVAPVLERAIPFGAVAVATQREAVAAVPQRLAAGDRVARTGEAEAVGAVLGDGHVRRAGQPAGGGEDADVEAADGAGTGERQAGRAAVEHLDAEAAPSPLEHVPAEHEGRRPVRRCVDEKSRARTDARRDRVVGAERARADEDVPAVAGDGPAADVVAAAPGTGGRGRDEQQRDEEERNEAPHGYRAPKSNACARLPGVDRGAEARERCVARLPCRYRTLAILQHSGGAARASDGGDGAVRRLTATATMCRVIGRNDCFRHLRRWHRACSTRQTMPNRRHRSSSGFTLMELLVVVAILGILCAIAIPVFSGRQGKAFDARVMQDARNVATAEEAYWTDTLAYFDGDCALMPGVNLSPGVICTATATPDTFQIETRHPQATRVCRWISNVSPNLACTAAGP